MDWPPPYQTIKWVYPRLSTGISRIRQRLKQLQVHDCVEALIKFLDLVTTTNVYNLASEMSTQNQQTRGTINIDIDKKLGVSRSSQNKYLPNHSILDLD